MPTPPANLRHVQEPSYSSTRTLVDDDDDIFIVDRRAQKGTYSDTRPGAPVQCHAQADSDSERPACQDHDRDDENAATTSKLPIFQLFIVYFIMLSEPLTATAIYPFVNQFVQETGVTHGDEKKTGYFAGMIESAFFVTEGLTVFHWGWASDRIGRRPILMLGPLGLTVAMLGFGLSSKFWELVVWRCFQGVFNGNIGVSKSVLAELANHDEKRLADVFSLMPFVWSLGLIVGPTIGGLLARPATRWPNSFGRIKLFREYPYFLACAVAGLFAFVSYLLTLLGLKETLPTKAGNEKKRAQRDTPDAERQETTGLLAASSNEPDYGTTSGTASSSATITRVSSSATILGDAEEAAAKEGPVSFRDLMIPRVLIPLINYLFLASTDMGAHTLRPLMYSTSIGNGGLGLDPYQIGMIMGAWGVFNSIVQLGFTARLIKRFGPRNVYIASYASVLVMLGSFPVLTFLARRAGRVDAWVWVVLAIQLLATVMSFMTYACIHMFIVDSAPTKASLGATNGLAQMLGCAVRSVAPAMASSLFSVSLERQLAGGYLVYYILIGLALMGVRTSFLLPAQLHGQKK